jgi:hypothetical protein
VPPGRPPQDLGAEEADGLRRAHHRLRKASQDLESFTAPPRMKGRWEPLAVPDEVMEAARSEMGAAWAALWRQYAELLGWEAPGAPS